MEDGLISCTYCAFCPPLPKDEKRIACRQAGKKISNASLNCEHFSPKKYFFCRKNNQYLNQAVCISRRLNVDLNSTFDTCKKCRQFPEVFHILKAFAIDIEKREEPKRKIKRRHKKVQVKIEKKITRRNKQTRKIKRRK